MQNAIKATLHHAMSTDATKHAETFISRYYAKLRDFIEEKSVLAFQTKHHGNARVYLDSKLTADKNTIDKMYSKVILKSLLGN